jgi:aminoglycoside phosphotransferase family enzyme
VHEFLTGDGESHLILPIAMARLDVVRKKVTTMQLNHTSFTGTRPL